MILAVAGGVSALVRRSGGAARATQSQPARPKRALLATVGILFVAVAAGIAYVGYSRRTSWTPTHATVDSSDVVQTNRSGKTGSTWEYAPRL